MNDAMNNGLRDAMRLMQSGDLHAATAAIQRQLGGHPHAAPDARPAAEHAAIDGQVVPDASTTESRFISGSHAAATGKRRYKLFIPGGEHTQPLPLIVMLHGCTQTPSDFATGTRMNDVAAEHDCFVVYPEQPRSANHSLCWNWFNTGDQRRDSGEPAIIASLVGELAGKYAIDKSRIYVAGLSAGGAMAAILGQTHPELFAAVGVHSGLPFGAAHDLPSALAAMRGGGDAAANPRDAMPTIVFHGDRDTTVNPVNGDKVAIQATGPCDCAVTEDKAEAGERKFSRKVFKDADGAVVVESWTIHGGAHKWSGGDARGSHTDSAGPDASREMMRFFLERTRH